MDDPVLPLVVEMLMKSYILMFQILVNITFIFIINVHFATATSAQYDDVEQSKEIFSCPKGMKQYQTYKPSEQSPTNQKNEVWCSVDVDTESRIILWSDVMLSVRNLRIDGCITDDIATVIASLPTLKNIEKLDISGPGCLMNEDYIIASSTVLTSLNELLVGDLVITNALDKMKGYSRKSNAEIETIAEQMFSIKLSLYPLCNWAGCPNQRQIYGIMYSELFYPHNQLTNAVDNWDKLSIVAEIVNDMDLRITFVGNVDEQAVDIFKPMSSWELSALNAARVADMFIEKGSVDPQLVTVEGNGKYSPICDVSVDDSIDCHNKNNFIEILIEPSAFTPLRDWGALIGIIKNKIRDQ